MSEFLSAAAAALGIPEALVQRAAAARAAETGSTADQILQAWAGGEAVARSAPAAAPTAAAEPEIVPPQVGGPPEQSEDEGGASEAGPSFTQPSPPAATTRMPVPAEVSAREAAHLPEVITVPTAGIRERTSSSIPKWLTTLLLVAPLFALFALGGFTTGECGEATELMRDVVTGEIVNCDGSEFTGSGGPGGGVDFISLGGSIFAGTEVASATCFGCHGSAGQGGVGPGMGGVINTFASCEDHVEWVTLGATGFREQGRTTYGDTNQAVGSMPGFGATLTEEQIRSVVAFERVRFAGGDRAEVEADCGLVEPDEDEDEDATDGIEEAGVSDSIPSSTS